MDLNTRVLETLISAISLRKTIEQEKRTLPRFIMLEHYDDVVITLETIIQFSRPL